MSDTQLSSKQNKKYYSERNGLLKDELHLELDDLRTMFFHIFKYFSDRDCFEPAFKGIWKQVQRGNLELISSPTMSPSPEVFFAVHLKSKEVWPIFEFIYSYDEATLFSVIEILYDHIGYWDYEREELISDTPKAEYAEQVNNLLRAYGDGFYLEPTNGFIMKQSNQALKEQLKYDGTDMEPSVYEQLRTASEMYYRFDSNLETKKKAINVLADIMEKVRDDLKVIFDSSTNNGPKPHDKMIFGIVNNYNIRHNKANQLTDYSKEIWYDWMMQYYTSVIIAYYKLNAAHAANVTQTTP